jgi:hypothetical protein
MAASGAQADVVITNSRTTPILTSNATGTGADNIRLGSGGSIVVTSGVAVTVDTNNFIDLDQGSSITLNNSADGTTAILVNDGATAADVTIGGSIRVTDNIDSYSDTDGDGDLDGPFANGADRYGVRLTGAAALTGNVLVESSGSILVEGTGSRGISLERALVGNLTSFGSIQAIGTNAIAVSSTEAGAVTGSVRLDGNIGVAGEGASAVNLQGDISGRLTLQAGIGVTGYRYTQRPNATATGRLDDDDLLQGGPAVVIGGNVGGGVVLDVRPEDASTTETDEDGDGIADASEGNSNISVTGAAPAVLVGSATRDITLGVAGTNTLAYGLINRGTINADSIYDSISATAIQLGAAGGGTVTIDGGVRNEGQVIALAREASATALQINAGVTTPRFDNTGSITAAGNTSVATTPAIAVSIAAGANLPALTNDGVILASTTGGVSGSTAILDQSGTLTAITNRGNLQALLGTNAAGDPLSPSAIATAIDVSANTTGVTVRQVGVTAAPTDSDPDTDNDGVPDSREPVMTGDVRFGSGADVFSVENGVVQGDIFFGAGADQLSITGGALVRGAITDIDGLLTVDVANGTLDARQIGVTNVTGLNIGADSNLIVTVDPATGNNGGFRVNGAATIAAGAGLGVRFNSLITDARRFTIIDADTLTAGAIDQVAVQGNSPYLFVVSAGVDAAAGDVFIDARRRTATEANLIGVESQAFDAFYGSLSGNDQLRDLFIAQADRGGFIELYEQMLPDHSGGPLLSLASGVDAVTRALSGRNATVAPGETSAWLQEINFYADKDKTDTYGFRSEGFGVAGGVERGTSLGAFGVTVAFTSSDIEDPEAEAEELLSASLIELGLSWRAQGQAWATWARAAGGYATFDSTRQLVSQGINLRNESSWNGFTLSLAAGASYERNFGRLSVRPEAYLEYFSLSEEAHTEQGANDGFNLAIEDRDGHLFAGVAAVNIGYGFGENGWIRPEVRLGWRQNISVDPGETIARFISGGGPFTLAPESIEGGGLIAGFNLSVGNDLGRLSVTADAEMIEDYIRYTLLLRASFRF